MPSDIQEYLMVRITIEAHAMLKEICENEKRSMGNQAEVLIEAAYNAMKATQHEARQFQPVAGRVQLVTTVGQ